MSSKAVNLLEIQKEAKLRGIDPITALHGLLRGTIRYARRKEVGENVSRNRKRNR